MFSASSIACSGDQPQVFSATGFGRKPRLIMMIQNKFLFQCRVRHSGDFLLDCVYEDCHPGNEVLKTDFMKLERVARTDYLTLWEVANLHARPKVDKQLPAELTR
jgi:hypothetical protein